MEYVSKAGNHLGGIGDGIQRTNKHGDFPAPGAGLGFPAGGLVWSLKGVRVVTPVERRFEWGYLFLRRLGASRLEVKPPQPHWFLSSSKQFE